jgi:hypothetical protein
LIPRQEEQGEFNMKVTTLQRIWLTMHRPDQLNLPDDPAFMPELDLNFDLSVFDMPSEKSGSSSFMSPPSLMSSRSSQQADEDHIEPPLELPFVNTSTAAGLGGLEIGKAAGLSSAARSEGRAPRASVLEEETGIIDVGWEFDEYGNMIETAQAQKPPTVLTSAEDVLGSRLGTDSAISARVRQEHAEGLQVAQQVSVL